MKLHLASDAAAGFNSAVALHLRSLGFTELAAGNTSVAAAHCLRALTIARDEVGIGEPALMRLHPDAVTALLAVGNIDEAERLTAELDVSTERNHLPWSTAMAGRCHGVLNAASGDRLAAIDVLGDALINHQRLAMPFEEARTRLLLSALVALLPTISLAAPPTAAQNCEAALETASAKFAQCRINAEAKYAKDLDSGKRATAIGRCSSSFPVAPQRGGAESAPGSEGGRPGRERSGGPGSSISA